MAGSPSCSSVARTSDDRDVFIERTRQIRMSLVISGRLIIESIEGADSSAEAFLLLIRSRFKYRGALTGACVGVLVSRSM